MHVHKERKEDKQIEIVNNNKGVVKGKETGQGLPSACDAVVYRIADGFIFQTYIA